MKEEKYDYIARGGRTHQLLKAWEQIKIHLKYALFNIDMKGKTVFF